MDSSPQDEWRIQNMRRLLSKIADRKKAEKAKAQQLETHLKRLSFCLSVLLVIQFALNVGQTSVYGGVNKHVVGVLSVLASVNTFAIALLGNSPWVPEMPWKRPLKTREDGTRPRIPLL